MVDSPIREVSGACLAGSRLVLVGDAEPVLAWADWSADLSAPWHTVDLRKVSGAPEELGQFEAVEWLAGDVVLIASEEPGMVLAVDLRREEVTRVWRLRVKEPSIKKAWNRDPNSRAEGMFFGPDRLFIVKEKHPAAILEFAARGEGSIGEPVAGVWHPAAGDVLVAVAATRIDLADASDATVVDGQLWLLSDEERCIVRWASDERLDLPKRITKPEALLRTPDGRWLIGSDTPDGRDALHLL